MHANALCGKTLCPASFRRPPVTCIPLASLRPTGATIGIVVITLALTFLVCSQVGGWWIWLPLAVLLIGGVGPGAVMLFVKDPEGPVLAGQAAQASQGG
jgi:hypothetical protein